MKYRHFMTKELEPELHADIYTNKKDADLYVWFNYAAKYSRSMPSQMIFTRKCKTEAEAIDIMKSFGHGYEYIGVRWVEVMHDGSIQEID